MIQFIGHPEQNTQEFEENKNFKISVLGEVAQPAPYILPNEKVTVLDAIGLAGDLTIYGKRENIMLIQENDGKKEIHRFKLNSSNTFNSLAFYLQQNNILFVGSNKTKAATLDIARTQTLTLLASFAPVFAILISRL